MTGKVAIVTGANKGIGFAIVKGLCERFQGNVYLTSRDITRGQNAVKELNKLGLKPLFHQLDVTDIESVKSFRDYIKEKHGGIDVLVNNAAIAFAVDAKESFSFQAEQTTFVNYFCLVSLCNIIFPLLKYKARVVNLSSSAGHLCRIPSQSIKEKLAKCDLTEPQLSELVKQFVETARNGTSKAEGWGESTYVVSKVAVSALTFIQHRQYGNGPQDLSINCVHPGYVDTDMSSHKGNLTIEEGAVAALYLALDAPEDLRGAYVWHDKTIIDWFAESQAWV